MKHSRIQLLITLATLVVAATLFVSTARSSRGQTQRPKTESPVKPTALVREPSKPLSASAAPALIAAAEENSVLRNELVWTFGGKAQRGWFLYDLLIRQTLNTQKETATTDFASSLLSWQKQVGLEPQGVLDEDSLMALVSQWQNNRLQDRTLAAPEQLLTAPASDFYDPERLEELRQVERQTYAAYKRMIAAAIADPTLKLAHTRSGELAPEEKYFKIISAFRSREYQERLRRESPNAGTAGLAVNSPHFTGRALDLYVGGEPVDTRDANRAIQVDTPAYRWLVRNAERFGFRPYFYEPWHWEYVR
jgi:LAS superfamily LD-carboxypeptidase LdcB